MNPKLASMFAHFLPAVGAVDIAGTQRAAFQITELIEHEAGDNRCRRNVAVPHAILLFAMGRPHATISDTRRRRGPKGCTIAVSTGFPIPGTTRDTTRNVGGPAQQLLRPALEPIPERGLTATRPSPRCNTAAPTWMPRTTSR